MRARRPLSALRLLTVAALTWAGCEPSGEAADSVQIVAREARYRVELEATPPASRDESGLLKIRVEPAVGWKLVPEAPARLRFELLGDLWFENNELAPQWSSGDDVDRLTFATEFRALRAGRSVARAGLKFGICKDTKDQCVIVRRDLDLPVRVVPHGPAPGL